MNHKSKIKIASIRYIDSSNFIKKTDRVNPIFQSQYIEMAVLKTIMFHVQESSRTILFRESKKWTIKITLQNSKGKIKLLLHNQIYIYINTYTDTYKGTGLTHSSGTLGTKGKKCEKIQKELKR